MTLSRMKQLERTQAIQKQFRMYQISLEQFKFMRQNYPPDTQK